MEPKKPSNPIVTNPDNVYKSESRLEDCATLRDYYSGIAMQYFVTANNGNFSDNDNEQIFYLTDTMLKVRQKTEL